MSKIRYAVWGKDQSYRWLWLASLVAGIEAAKKRYNSRVTYDLDPKRPDDVPPPRMRPPADYRPRG
jgi:hypothetical protein